jgi:integrase
VAAVVSRPRRDGTTAYKVQWRLGGSRDGTWQSETFDDRRKALKFQALVESNHHLWPEGWVKGWGFGASPSAVDAAGARTLLEEFGTAYVRRLTSAGPDTQTRYLAQVSRLVGWITDATGFVPDLETFSSDDDRDWINARRRAGSSPKTIANYHGLLAAIFKDAVHKGLVVKNPCEGVRLPAMDSAEDDGDKQFLTEDEFTLLLAAMHADSRDLLIVAVGTGLRWGELTALRVEDLQLGGKVPHLSVRRAWKRNGTGDFAVEGEGRFYLGSPKTRESRRKVSLSKPVVDVLRRVTARKDSNALVFPGSDGERLDQGNWYAYRWQVAVRAARAVGLGCSPRFHDLRHTHAAWLISAGVPLPVIQKRLGHKSIKITVDVYGGLLVQTHEVADLAMARALAGKRIVVPGAPDAPIELSPVSAPAG